MTATFTLTLEEYTAWILDRVGRDPGVVRRQRKPSRAGRNLRVVGLVLLAIGFLVQLFLVIQDGGWNSSRLLPCVFTAIVFYQLAFTRNPVEDATRNPVEATMRKMVQQQYRRGELDQLLAEQRWELREHELLATTSYGTTAIAWSGVEQIVAAPEHAYFVHGGNGANILPMRAFASEQEFTAFVETAQAYRSAARPLSLVEPTETAEAGITHRPGGVVEVVYKLTPEDGAELFRQPSLRDIWSSRLPSRWLGLLIVGIISIAIVLMTVQLQAVAPWVGFILIPLGVLFILPFLFIAIVMLFPANPLMRRWWKRQLKKQAYFTSATHRLRLTPEHLMHAYDAQMKATPWHAVEQILRSENHAFFRVSRLEILILPKRAFAQEADFDAFVEAAEKYHQAAATP